MNRRSFLQWLAGAGAAMAAAGEIDVERMLWVPGHKTIFLPPEGVIIPDAPTVDRVLEAHGVRMPRYTLTTREAGTLLFDKNWQLLNGKELLAKPAGLTAGDLEYLQRGLDEPTSKKRRLWAGGPYFGDGGGFTDGYARATRVADLLSHSVVDIRPGAATKAGPIIGTDY